MRGLAAIGLAALASVVLTVAPASAAPNAPTAYTAVTRAYPLFWASGGVPVGEFRVPYVSGSTNHLAVVESNAALARPDLSITALPPESVAGLTCTGYDEKLCIEGKPFRPDASADHPGGVDAARSEQIAGWSGKDGKFPGHVKAVTDCAGDCGPQLVRTTADAGAPTGGIGTYITVGSSNATQDVSLDDRGRLLAIARSELRDVVIGPKGEIRMSSLVTSAQAFGTGAEGSKDGRSELKISDFVILDHPVELTRSGLKLTSGAPSEQEAYDGAKALLEQLKQQAGITLEFPNFDKALDRQPGHVTVKTDGLRIRFERTVDSPEGVPSSDLAQILDLGSATSVVAAFDSDRQIEVSMDGSVPVVQPGPPPANSTTTASANPAAPAAPTTLPPTTKPLRPNQLAAGPIKVVTPSTSTAPPATATPDSTAGPAPAPSLEPGTLEQPGPDDVALGLNDVKNAFRGARAVSNAFGAFLGLALILPVARVVIRRLG